MYYWFRLKFLIKTSWNSEPVNHDAVGLNIYTAEDGLGVEIDAPFFNNPPKPNGPPGLPFQGLWEYEGNFHWKLSQIKIVRGNYLDTGG